MGWEEEKTSEIAAWLFLTTQNVRVKHSCKACCVDGVCELCANALGAKWPDNHKENSYVGICGICCYERSLMKSSDCNLDENGKNKGKLTCAKKCHS